jgi:hypothetical protein
MDTKKFLKDVEILENILRRKVGEESKKSPFLFVIRGLSNKGIIEKDTRVDLEKLWEFRNKVCLLPVPEESISDEAQALLLSLIHNPKLS